MILEMNGTRWNPKSVMSGGRTLKASKKKPVLDTTEPTMLFPDRKGLICNSSS